MCSNHLRQRKRWSKLVPMASTDTPTDMTTDLDTIKRKIIAAAGWFLDADGDLCYLATIVQTGDAIVAERELAELVDHGVGLPPYVTEADAVNLLGVHSVPAHFVRTTVKLVRQLTEEG